MIEKVIPVYKFTCDRCGVERVSDSGGLIDGIFEVEISYNSTPCRTTTMRKQLCKRCKEEFAEFISNYFDPVNREGGEDGYCED